MTDPFKITGPAVVSFSGGETSGMMLHRIIEAHGGTLPPDVKVLFQNTGIERPETLDFVERCGREWGVPITWLEYRYEGLPMQPLVAGAGRWEERERTVWSPVEEADDEREPLGTRVERVWVPDEAPKKRKRRGDATFAVVDYATASRNGEPFEALIRARNMLPNPVSRFCTVELKIRTAQRYLKSLGWHRWTTAIGFRRDEPQRVAKLAVTNRHEQEEPCAPLYEAGVTHADVKAFWAKQPFRLQLEQHAGNCTLCFLKGEGKILRLLKARPDLAEWWIRMESIIEGGRCGTDRFRNDRPSYAALLERSQRASLPMMGDEDEPDQLSVSCHCTD